MSGVRAARHYIPGMVKRGWGRVVFISSESGVAIPRIVSVKLCRLHQAHHDRGTPTSERATGKQPCSALMHIYA